MARGWISPGATARFSSPKAASRQHVLHDDLRLGILEHEPSVPRELAGPVPAGVQSGDAHAAAELPAVEVRHQPQRGAKER